VKIFVKKGEERPVYYFLVHRSMPITKCYGQVAES